MLLIRKVQIRHGIRWDAVHMTMVHFEAGDDEAYPIAAEDPSLGRCNLMCNRKDVAREF